MLCRPHRLARCGGAPDQFYCGSRCVEGCRSSRRPDGATAITRGELRSSAEGDRPAAEDDLEEIKERTKGGVRGRSRCCSSGVLSSDWSGGGGAARGEADEVPPGRVLLDWRIRIGVSAWCAAVSFEFITSSSSFFYDDGAAVTTCCRGGGCAGVVAARSLLLLRVLLATTTTTTTTTDEPAVVVRRRTSARAEETQRRQRQRPQ